jgi:protein-disulfide isomerase
MRLRSGLIIACCIGLLGFCTIAQAQHGNDEKNLNLQDSISSLAKDVKILVEQQQEVVDQLKELNRLLPSNSAKRPVPQLPATLNTHHELFEGDSAARVAIVEYSDFECPFCGGYERETYPQVFENYIKTGKVKLFYRDLPLPMHPHAMQAARAAHCAGEQGKYWEMHDSLFARQNALSDPALLDRAKSLGLDEKKFDVCLSSGKNDDDIHKSVTEAQLLAIQGTPTFFIGTISPDGNVLNIGKIIYGAHTYEEFKSALDGLLASKSPVSVSAH